MKNFKNEYKGMYTHLHVMNYHSFFVKTGYNACDISRLEKYMFFHLPQIKHSEEPKQECLEINDSNEKMETIFKKDPLFWMMYIHVYSKAKYDDLSKYTNTQMDEKQKIADFFTKTPNAMKNVNMKMTKNNIKEHISDLMTNVDITVESLHVLAIYYKCKVIIYNDRVYYAIVPDDYDETNEPLVIYKKNATYNYVLHPDIDNILCRFLLEKHDMPLKAISTYKVDELRTISDKLGLKPEKNDKQSHYIAITKHCIL
jgi:hypothetical protein